MGFKMVNLMTNEGMELEALLHKTCRDLLENAMNEIAAPAGDVSAENKKALWNIARVLLALCCIQPGGRCNGETPVLHEGDSVRVWIENLESQCTKDGPFLVSIKAARAAHD